MAWFADIDRDQTNTDFVWQPCISDNDDNRVLGSLPTWFASKRECEQFIRTELIPNTRTLEE